jgi:hypothetical protein
LNLNLVGFSLPSMPAADKKPQTLYDKVFEDHIVNEQEDGTILLYIGTHIPVRLLKISKELTPSLQTDTLFTKLRHR